MYNYFFLKNIHLLKNYMGFFNKYKKTQVLFKYDRLLCCLLHCNLLNMYTPVVGYSLTSSCELQIKWKKQSDRIGCKSLFVYKVVHKAV